MVEGFITRSYAQVPNSVNYIQCQQERQQKQIKDTIYELRVNHENQEK